MEKIVAMDMAKIHGQSTLNMEGKIEKPKAKPKAKRKVTKKDEEMVKQLVGNNKVKQEDEEQREPLTSTERAQIIRKLGKYFKEFGSQIPWKLPPSLGKKSDGELETLLKQVELDLGSSNGLMAIAGLYTQFIGGVELLNEKYDPFGLDLTSKVRLSQVISTPQAQAQLEPILKELAIKYDDYFATGPWQRLLLTTGQLIMTVNAANQGANNKRMNDEVPVSMEEEFADI